VTTISFPPNCSPTSVRFSELDGAAVGVWGAGREIKSFAAQLARRLPSARIAVVALDDGGEDVPPELIERGARVVTGPGVVAALASCDVLVRSPGVSIYREELRELSRRGVPTTTATAMWLAETGGENVIGVTGTKGKSTTATLLAHLARAAGRTVHLSGNIGAPALDLLDAPPGDLVVLELSSYQIADLVRGPDVAVMTNLYPEHLDWHGTEATYRADKLRLLGLDGVRATVVNGRDPALVESARIGRDVVRFGVPGGWDVTLDGVALGGTLVAPWSRLPLRGEHNALNLCAALAALSAAGVPAPRLPDALDGIVVLPHRLEVVADRDGVVWVDDSISTTPESTLAALQSFPDREIVLIAGGKDRGQDYTLLGRELAKRGAVAIGLPVTGSRLVEAARTAGVPDDRAVEVADMESAVAAALRFATRGGAVLLSPAAASYNSYVNFEERGADFRARIAP
jgi:UDP-N-acetylmuramoylalanine--D-glutamate ligase